MKLHRREKPTTSFSLASITDIIFLLLIFLLVGYQPTLQDIPVDLPTSDLTLRDVQKEVIYVTLTKEKKYYVGDELVPTLDDIGLFVSQKMRVHGIHQVVVRIDRTLSIAEFLEVADRLTVLGAHISIATLKKN